MSSNNQNRLNIFVDETGEPAILNSPSDLYGVSFVIHRQTTDVGQEIRRLNERYSHQNFDKTFHMSDIIHGNKDYVDMDIPERRKIFTTLYRFAMRIDVKYHSIMIEKKNVNNLEDLAQIIKCKISNFILENLSYFQEFDEIVIYYDGGQSMLDTIIDETFGIFPGYRKDSNFSQKEKKLFQVADMLTTIDRILYKKKNKMAFSSNERYFFSREDIKVIKKDIARHRILP